MAKVTTKQASKKGAAAAKPTRKAVPKAAAAETTALSAKPISDMSGEELVVANFATLSTLVEALEETLEMLVQKAESMAYHIIATEEILAEIVAANGLDLTKVNTRIRAKIAAGTAGLVDPARAIDAAAAIASPLPRR